MLCKIGIVILISIHLVAEDKIDIGRLCDFSGTCVTLAYQTRGSTFSRMHHEDARMPQPYEETSTTKTTTSVISPELLKSCSHTGECHCINGTPVCYNAKCFCLYASAYDNLDNSTKSDAEATNESQQLDPPH